MDGTRIQLQRHLALASENIITDLVTLSDHGDITIFSLADGNTLLLDTVQTVQPIRSLDWISHAGRIAYDWIGQKLYWGGIDGIMRSDLLGERVELVSTSMSRDLELDPYLGMMYWSRYYSVQAAHMDGRDHIGENIIDTRNKGGNISYKIAKHKKDFKVCVENCKNIRNRGRGLFRTLMPNMVRST